MAGTRMERRAGTRRADAGASSAFVAVLLAAVAAAIAVRWIGVASQVLGDDELHSLRSALAGEAGMGWSYLSQILYIRLLLDLGVRPSELHFRVPALLSGILLVAWLPWRLRREVGTATAGALAWLLALSPVLVLYSRISRSYAPVALVAVAAGLAFFAWLEKPAARSAILYALLAALAVWLHLGAGPFVVAPVAFGAGWKLAAPALGREAETPRWRDFAAVVGALGLALACVSTLAPVSEAAFLDRTRGDRVPTLATWVGVGQLFAGTGEPRLAALVVGLAALGWVLLARRKPLLAAFTLALVAGQVVGVLATRPRAVQLLLPLNRYLIVCLPFFLLWLAAALALPWRRAGGVAARFGPALATALLLALLLAGGPLARPAFRKSAFVHHNDFLSFQEPLPRVAVEDVPRFYSELEGAEPGCLVEFPWHSSWNFARAIPAYQRIHGRSVRVSGMHRDLRDPALALRNFVAPRPETLAQVDCAWIVVHLDIGAEEDRIRAASGRPPRPAAKRERKRLARAGAALAAQLAARWGSPEYSDATLAAWRLPR